VYHAPLIRYYSAGTASRITRPFNFIRNRQREREREREREVSLFRETRNLRVTLDSLGAESMCTEVKISPVTPAGVPTDAMIVSIMKSRMKSPCRARPHLGGTKVGARAKAARLLLARRRSASSGGCCGHADVRARRELGSRPRGGG